MKALLLLLLLGAGGYYAYTNWPSPPPPPPPVRSEPDRYAFAESFFFKSRVKALVVEIERRTVSAHQNIQPNTSANIAREVAILRDYTMKEAKLYDAPSFEKAIVRALCALGHLPDQADYLMRRILQESGSSQQ